MIKEAWFASEHDISRITRHRLIIGVALWVDIYKSAWNFAIMRPHFFDRVVIIHVV
jgi:hypothetical protein